VRSGRFRGCALEKRFGIEGHRRRLCQLEAELLVDVLELWRGEVEARLQLAGLLASAEAALGAGGPIVRRRRERLRQVKHRLIQAQQLLVGFGSHSPTAAAWALDAHESLAEIITDVDAALTRSATVFPPVRALGSEIRRAASATKRRERLRARPLVALVTIVVAATLLVPGADGPLVALVGNGEGQHRSGARLDDGRELIARARIRPRQAISLVRGSVAGTIEDVELEYEEQTLLYDIHGSNGEVKIDASTGRLLDSD
jgi:hypothetical protein